MLKKKGIKKALKLLEGNKIYLDSADSRAGISTDLSILPLLSDKILFYCDKKTNLTGFEKRLQEFIEEGFVIPLSNSEETLPRIVKEEELYILKDDLFDTVLFRKHYDFLIQEDLEDGNFVTSCKKINQNPTNTAFSLNWDILVCEALDTPIILNSKIKSAWESKVPRLPHSIYPPPRMNYTPEITKFLNEIKAYLPINMNIDEIKEFRKQKIATSFRVWLNNQIQNAQLKETVYPIPVDKYLLQEFNSLAQQYNESTSMKTSVIVGFVAGMAGTFFAENPILSAGMGATAALGNYAFENLSNHLKKKFGKHRWVYLLKD